MRAVHGTSGWSAGRNIVSLSVLSLKNFSSVPASESDERVSGDIVAVVVISATGVAAKALNAKYAIRAPPTIKAVP